MVPDFAITVIGEDVDCLNIRKSLSTELKTQNSENVPKISKIKRKEKI